MALLKKKEPKGILNYAGEFICYKEDTWKQDLRHNWVVYMLFLPVLAFFVIFCYAPMFGVLMAFEDFSFAKGIFRSDWVGMQNFVELFQGEMFPNALRNTVAMALLNLTVGFVAPIVLALLISQMKSKGFTRTVQTVSYLPNFVSAVVVCSLATEFLSSTGAVTMMLTWLGFDQQNWLANPNIPVFWLINTFLGIWQGAGWGTIVYIAAISNVNGDMHEAAAIDGANRWQRLWKVTMPSILPLIIMMFVLQIGLVFRTGFDKVLLLYIPATYETADCLNTYTYRMAFTGTPNYGLSAASGLFQSVVSTALLVFSNSLSKKTTKMSLY